MENRRHPHPHPYPHTQRIKRAYGDENSFGSNNDATTLIGNNCVAADSHRQNLSAQYGQQRRRTSQSVSIASPLDPSVYSEENYCLQGSLQPPNQDILYSTTPRQLADNPSGSGLYHASYGSNLTFGNFNQAQSRSLQYQNPSITFGHMGPNGQRDQRLPHFVMEEPVDSGSEDSRTLRSSQSLSRTASGSGPYDLMLNRANDTAQLSIADSSRSCTLIGDLAENDTREGLAALGTHDPYAPYSENWQHQDSGPWTMVGVSHPQRFVSNQRLSLEPIGEELYGDSQIQPMDISSLDPSQISFEPINVSQTSDEMPAVEYSTVFQDVESSPFVGMGYPFPGYQDLDGGRIDETVLEAFDEPGPYSELPGSIIELTRSFHSPAGDPSTLDMYTPLARQASVETNHTMNHGPLTIQSSTSEKRNRQVFEQESARPAAAAERIWENSVVRNGAFSTLASNAPLSSSTKKPKGSRTGPLSSEKREEAANVRRKKSCWHCWVMHIKCDLHEVCENCRRLPAPYYSRVCLRTSELYQTDCLFPEFVVARHSKVAIEKVIGENILAFTDNEIEVQISSSPHYPPMTLSVCEFDPKNNDYLVLYHSPPNASSPSSALEEVYGPPVGLSSVKLKGKAREEFREKISTHITEMTKHHRFPGDATNGDAAPISRKILEAINRYRSSRPKTADDGLIRKAMRLLATHYFMRKIISFTQDSNQKVYNNLISPRKLPYNPRPSAKLLNSQVKREVHLLQRRLTKDILHDLEIDMRKKSPGLYATCFSVLAILCMCIEAVQLSIDGFIVQGMLTGDPGSNAETRADGFHTSRLLEDHFFGDLLDIFHKVHSSGSFKKFFPIRDGATAENSKDLDQSSVRFINEVHEIVRCNSDYLEEKAKNPTWGVEENLLSDHYRYRRENSGRLVAKFLLSFC